MSSNSTISTLKQPRSMPIFPNIPHESPTSEIEHQPIANEDFSDRIIDYRASPQRYFSRKDMTQARCPPSPKIQWQTMSELWKDDALSVPLLFKVEEVQNRRGDLKSG